MESRIDERSVFWSAPDSGRRCTDSREDLRNSATQAALIAMRIDSDA
jgi:hypothetical protein